MRSLGGPPLFAITTIPTALKWEQMPPSGGRHCPCYEPKEASDATASHG